MFAFPDHGKKRLPPTVTRASEAVSERKSPYGPLLALLGICVLIVVGRPNWAVSVTRSPASIKERASGLEVPKDRAVFGYIETAGISRRIVGRINQKLVLVGWTAFTNPKLFIARLVIQVDGIPRAEVDQLFDRADVADAFGRPNFLRSGWETPIPLDGLEPGIHQLTVQAVASTGESADLAPIQLKVIE